ncbi:MAG: RagB/SusD family nutrient uptake outer membrane protein [Cyclobacteriaceae bacterium]
MKTPNTISIKSQWRLLKRGLTLTLVAMVVSCNEFLDELPDNRVTLDNLDKSAQLLANAYSVSSEAFTDWMTDNSAYTRGVALRLAHSTAFEWGEFIDDPSEPDTPTFYWLESYNAIAHANEVLAALPEIEAVSENDIARKNAIESEALATRAYAHFMLVNLFGKHYQKTNSLSDLGVPFVDKPETKFIQTYRRNTVKEVYDRVEADLLRAIELNDDSFFSNSGKYHFNRNALFAFASRLYLFIGDYAKCVQYSSALLGSDPGSFVRDLTSDEFQNASSSIDAYPQLYSSPGQRSNLLLMRKISLVQRTDFGHGPTNAVYDDVFGANPFGSSDSRENPAFVKGENGLLPVRYENLFERSSLNSNVGTPYHIGIVFRGEEVLLNRAEAYVYQGNMTAALADLQVLSDRRYFSTFPLTINAVRDFFGVGSSPFVSNQDVMIEYLLLERRKEFLMQGLRWFDIRRYELPVTHVLADGTTTIELKAKDNRKVLQLPTSAIEVGGLTPNPR